jgi:hypothetical protein
MPDFKNGLELSPAQLPPFLLEKLNKLIDKLSEEDSDIDDLIIS